jgi:hypothetical protein
MKESVFFTTIDFSFDVFEGQKESTNSCYPSTANRTDNEIGEKLYPDFRHSFLITLASQARKLRHALYERVKFDSALRSLIVISLHMRPLQSAEAARRIKGVGGVFYADMLKESKAGPDVRAQFVPRQNKHSCVAAAALVALLELEEEGKSVGLAPRCFPMEDLISKVNELLDSRAKAKLDQTS